ncbi:MAG: DUF4159 domain-containing protein [Reyranellaceae bacterium]
MLNLGALAFAAPWALALAIVLPVIWWLLRLLPPSPKLIKFPAISLLLGLKPEEETPHKLPLWLAILRLLLVSLMIAALAQPLLNPAGDLEGSGPLVVVVDDGWAAAPGWRQRQEHVGALIDKAERAGRNVAILTTAPAAIDEQPLPRGLLRPADARALVNALKPKPWPTDRAALAQSLDIGAYGRDATVVWVADGLDDPAVETLADRLREAGSLQLLLPGGEAAPIALLPPAAQGSELVLRAQRPPAEAPRRIAVQASDEQGRALARMEMEFEAGAAQAQTPFTVPNELRNRVVRLDIERQGGAGSAVLLDERFRRRPVGVVGVPPSETGTPLLNDVYYLERALAPFAAISIADVTALMDEKLAVLLLPDSAAPSTADREALERWMASGGVVVRFAGPRLANAPDDPLAPVRLRAGERALGGAIAWGEPARLAEFSDQSPFAGLAVPPDVLISQQVLAEPDAELSDRTWARLSDGTPLVTAQRKGEGWLVLFHTSANTTWTNLPLSGLFVEMLQRLVALSRGVAGGKFEQALRPWRVLDGFGRLSDPPVGARPVTPEQAARFRPGPATPPGLYGEEGAQQAFNLGDRVGTLNALTGIAGGATLGLIEAQGEIDLVPFVLVAAMILLLADIFIALWLRGLLPAATRLRRSPAAVLAAALLLGGTALLAPPPAGAQPRGGADELVLRATLETRLAYVVTGNNEVDQVSRAGLLGLSNVLKQRTSVEPAEPVGVNPDSDELRLFPFIYWPVTAEQPGLSRQGIAAVDRFLKQGGIILFDTRDAHLTGGRTGTGQGTRELRRLLSGIEIPPLVAMPKDHVIGKSFYLLNDFPGRWIGASLWLEAGDGRVNDGVSSLVIGGNDWAGAWAVNSYGDPMLPVAPGGSNQRELAYRFGVNIVMYALTGNYKDDQVHLPKILERLVR